MSTWAEAHRPKTLDEILGNPTAISDLKKWAEAWARGSPDKRAVILQGDPGVGKTSAALALAHDMGWAVVEMNASDSRTADAIKKVATRGSVLQTFSPTGEFLRAEEGGRKLIILDEADNLFGREDRGGIGAIVSLIQETKQPVVLIVNDYYALTRRSSTIRRICRTIKFQRINRAAMKSLLRSVSLTEGVEPADDVLDFVVDHSEGDLRAALNDLEAIAVGAVEVRSEATHALGARDREGTVFAALGEIFRSGDARRVRDAVNTLDESPEDLILWIDHNVPYEYPNDADRARAYDRLSRADIYLGRVRRRQDYGLWSFAKEMMSLGVATARQGRARGGELQFPQYLMQMSRSRSVRMARNSLALKIGRHLHVSRALVLNDLLPTFRALFRGDEELRIQLTAALRLEEKEVAFLLDEPEDSHAVKHLLEKAAAIAGPTPERTKRSDLERYEDGEASDS
jgi:replication factor C large subunit